MESEEDEIKSKQASKKDRTLLLRCYFKFDATNFVSIKIHPDFSHQSIWLAKYQKKSHKLLIAFLIFNYMKMFIGK